MFQFSESPISIEGPNLKLGNIRNVQLLPIKQLQTLKKKVRVFQVFDFSITAKIENSETSEIPNCLK